MINPWNDIVFPNDDFVHPMDRAVWKHRSKLPPQPYLGSFTDGRVMWLLGGFGTGDEMAADHPVYRRTVFKWARENLATQLPSTPNLWIGADCSDHGFLKTRDVRWWRRATGPLFKVMSPIVRERPAWQILSTNLFVLEGFPYPAKTRPNKLLSTHAFTAHLLKSWLATSRPIVLGRGEKFWSMLVPDIVGALRSNQVIRVKNVQAAIISPGNLVGGDSDFQIIVKALLGG